MRSEILIQSNRLETRVAYLENGELVDYKVEKKTSPTLVGSIYSGKVVRVLPGMQAAFVDIGLERAAFLYVGDVREEGVGATGADEEDIPKDYLRTNEPKIQELLNQGQRIMVQIAKDPIGTKGARVTTHISLASRRTVYLPTLDHFGISRKIENEDEKERLKSLLEENIKGGGMIVRTAGEGMTQEKLLKDLEFLNKVWGEIQEGYKKAEGVGQIYSEVEYSLRTLRDMLAEEVGRVIVEGDEAHKMVHKFVNQFMPKYQERIELYEEYEPLFEKYGIDDEVEKALANKVWLRSGGYLVFDEAEALVVIDVNTGKFVGKKNLEDTIFKTNMEAVREIAHQIRLRDCSGIIIIDFIDMSYEVHRTKVLQALESEVKKDRIRVSVISMTGLGLVELTRKRLRSSLRRTLTESCFYCSGLGTLKKNETIVCEIFRELTAIKKSKPVTQPFLVKCHSKIVNWVYSEESELMTALEEELGVSVIFQTDTSLHLEDYKISLSS